MKTSHLPSYRNEFYIYWTTCSYMNVNSESLLGPSEYYSPSKINLAIILKKTLGGHFEIPKKMGKGLRTNHVDRILGNFDPPSPHVDKYGFFRHPPPPALSTWFMNSPIHIFLWGHLIISIYFFSIEVFKKNLLE